MTNWGPAVDAAWPAWVRGREGVTDYMYLDTKANVTTGIGALLPLSLALKLPWTVKATGKPATQDEIKTEWNRVSALTKWQHLNGLNSVWRDSAKLLLSDATVNGLLADETDRIYTRLKQTVPFLDDIPADAKLGLLDESYQNGPAFLDLKEDGKYVWLNTREGVLAQDWNRVADAVPGSGGRAEARKLLFRNAAAVKAAGADYNKLWYPNEADVSTGGFDMATGKETYKTNGKDFVVKANTETVVQIDDKGNVSVVVGKNEGVDVQMVALFNTTAPTNVALWARVVDTNKKDGSDAKTVLDRAHGKLSFPTGTGWEISAAFKGAIVDPDPKDARDRRLRFVMWANQDITVTLVQYSGWRM